MVQVNHCIEDQQFRMEGRSRMMRRRMSRDSSQNLYIGQKLLIALFSPWTRARPLPDHSQHDNADEVTAEWVGGVCGRQVVAGRDSGNH